MAAEYPNSHNGFFNTGGPALMKGYVDDDYVYGTHITHDRGGLAFRYRISTGVMQTFDLSTIAGNPLELPLCPAADPACPNDDHYFLATAVGPNAAGTADHVNIVGNHHDNQGAPSGTFHYVRCTNVSDFTNAASWVAGAEPGANLDGEPAASGTAGGTYTYHWFERLSDGRLLWFMSQSETRSSSQGRDWIAFVRESGAWNPLDGIGNFATTENGPPTEADRVYVTGIKVEPNGGGAGVDKIHVMGIWRTNDTDPTSQQAPFYLYALSTDLTTWKAADGTVVSLPITWATRSAAEITGAPATCASYRGGVYVDTNGRPSGVFEDQDTNNFVELAWNGSTWTSTSLTSLALLGEPIKVRVNGDEWYRTNSTRRVAFKRADGSQTVRVGPEVVTSGRNFSASWCPVTLREDGYLIMNVGEGNTPKMVTFGNGARVRP